MLAPSTRPICARATLEDAQAGRQLIDRADVNIKRFGRLLADGRVGTRDIDFLGLANRKE